MYPSICKFFSKHLVMWQRVLSHTPIPVWFVGWKVGKMTGTSNLYQGSFPRSLINQGEALRYLHSNVPMFYCILSNGVRRVFSPWILSLWEDLAPVSLVWICFKSRIASPQLGGTLNDLTSVQFQSCCLCQCWCRRTLRIKGRNWNIRFEWIFKRETQIASNAYGGMSPLELPGASYSWDEGRFPHPAPIYFALGIPFSRTGWVSAQVGGFTPWGTEKRSMRLHELMPHSGAANQEVLALNRFQKLADVGDRKMESTSGVFCLENPLRSYSCYYCSPRVTMRLQILDAALSPFMCLNRSAAAVQWSKFKSIIV